MTIFTRTEIPFTDFSNVSAATSLANLNLNWREQDLPQRVRTKHVHRLHPYLGKFIPQLVEIFLRKYQPTLLCDPFCGSGTALVEAAAAGVPSVGFDISEFNCLLARVKTARYQISNLGAEVADILQETIADLDASPAEGLSVFSDASDYLRAWFHPVALEQLLRYRHLIPRYQHQDVLKIILSRAARSARLAPHFELDWPKKPQLEPYWCLKHRRTCRPAEDALQFLRRYSRDTVRRIAEYAAERSETSAGVTWADSRHAEYPDGIDLVVTSPPYVGVIDYHEQHRYAYELLGLGRRNSEEIGLPNRGRGKAAQQEYIGSIASVFRRLKPKLAANTRVVIIVNDRHGLYEDLATSLGFVEEERLQRKVNRRTGMRGREYEESVLVWANR